MYNKEKKILSELVRRIEKGGAVMATSSILTNVVIKDSKRVEALANALEASSRDPKRKPSAPTIPVLTDVEAVRKFFAQKEQKQ